MKIGSSIWIMFGMPVVAHLDMSGRICESVVPGKIKDIAIDLRIVNT